MAEHLLIERASRDFTVLRDGYRVGADFEVTVDEDGRPRSALGPEGALHVLVLDATASVLDLVEECRREGPAGRSLKERRLIIALVDRGREIRGFVLPETAATIVREIVTGVRGDSELFGPAEGRVGSSAIECPECRRVGQYDDVEPGETRCGYCGGVLRPV
ncbi:hypothetical protein [Actinomadura rayongensis]|uniref:Uncharacterized protein n=1 Tax=Actinomadura rayongensis TaxID=1429076 RepID=A0A6I4WE86_9ACTN|nr:hypothetical protein [Actinomadura rayongensis]MXQ64892.1 hypothetical protein [Actinomadura rayongensis]